MINMINQPWKQSDMSSPLDLIVQRVGQFTMAARAASAKQVQDNIDRYAPSPIDISMPINNTQPNPKDTEKLRQDMDGIKIDPDKPQAPAITIPDVNPPDVKIPTAGKDQSVAYTINKGDTLSSISKKYGTSVNDIVAMNGLTDAGAIKAGDTLNIPAIVQKVGQPLMTKSGPVTTGSITPDFVNTIKQWEGFKDKAYWDNGQWSIGHGTKATSPNQKVDPKLAEQNLVQELSYFRTRVENAANKVGASFTKNQLDALTSFDFNTGDGVKLIISSNGDVNNIMKRLPTWNKKNGIVNQGLVNRRANELKLFVSN